MYCIYFSNLTVHFHLIVTYVIYKTKSVMWNYANPAENIFVWDEEIFPNYFCGSFLVFCQTCLSQFPQFLKNSMA